MSLFEEDFFSTVKSSDYNNCWDFNQDISAVITADYSDVLTVPEMSMNLEVNYMSYSIELL